MQKAVSGTTLDALFRCWLQVSPAVSPEGKVGHIQPIHALDYVNVTRQGSEDNLEVAVTVDVSRYRALQKGVR